MRYFKIIFGYDDEQYIPIDETELEKAVYAHMTGKKASFDNGSISGDRITVIQPDFHRAMGWARGYPLGPDEYNILDDTGTMRNYAGTIGQAKDRVEYLMRTKREDLIGKNIDLPELDTPRGSIKALPQITAMAEKMSISGKTNSELRTKAQEDIRKLKNQ